MSFWGIGYGARPIRILQSVARGVLGSASREGGAASAALGGALHYFIAISMAVVYFLASRRLDVLRRRPIACGLVYGVLLYLVMNFVVLPLSASGMPKFDNVLWVALSVVMHMCFGVICGWSTWLASRPSAGARL